MYKRQELEIFQEAARISTEVEMEEWDTQAQEAKEYAESEMGVEFIEVDVDKFKEKVEPLHEKMLKENPHIQDIYDHIQEINAKAEAEEGK